MQRIGHYRRQTNIWPGFVDGLAALLMVVIFVLLIFTFGQFFLTDALTGRDKALGQLNQRLSELADKLSLEEASNAQLSADLAALQATLATTEDALGRTETQLESTTATLAQRDATIAEQRTELANLVNDVAALQDLKTQLEAEVVALMGSLEQSNRDLGMQTELSNRATAQVELLNRQLAALETQLSELNALLADRDATIAAQDLQIEDLGERLNLALASEVKRLASYRSDFFGRLREALGNHPDLRIEGDRFVFQSELLFDSASADLAPAGRQQVAQLADTLERLALEIPDDLDWVLRVDGHTDRRPIQTSQFPSNWELSTARALAIVKYLIELGVPPERLAATGFGAHHPLDDRQNELAYARNRRIELKLTAR